MNKFYSFSIVFLIFACMQKKDTHIIFFGDSITELGHKHRGYITRIDSICKAEKEGCRFTFTGSGISGNKVYDLYLRLDTDVLVKKPDVVVIYIGVNDVWHKRLLGTGTDPDKFEIFYQAIIDKLKEKDIRIILCTPAVIGEKTDFSNDQDNDLNQFSDIIRRLEKQNSLELVDLRRSFLDHNIKNNPGNKERGILTIDRVHLNEKGNLLVAEEMWKVINAVK